MVSDNSPGTSDQNILDMLMQKQQNALVNNLPQFAGSNSKSADSGVMDSLYAKLRE